MAGCMGTVISVLNYKGLNSVKALEKNTELLML